MRNFGKLDLPDFAFWVGIVEAIGDVERAGRVKVRIFGYHTPDKSLLPTSELPYAVPINPVTSAGVNGIMESPNFVQGSTVVGAFMDGEEGQIPVIFGTIAGVPAERDFKDGQGFSDPDQQFPREGSGTAAKSNSEEGIIAGAVGAITDKVTDAVTGAISSLTGGLGDGKDANDADIGTGYAGVGEPDISRLARGEAGETHYSLVNRRAKIADINKDGVATAKAPFKDGSIAKATGAKADTESVPWKMPDARGKKQDETESPQTYHDPKSGAAPTGEETSLYPFNQVTETLAGIVKEYDNTPGNIRISEFHPANTWYEIHNDGSKTTYVSGSDNVVIEGDSNVFIQGNANVTVGGTMKQKVKGDYYLEVEGNMFQTIHGERRTSVGQGETPGNDIYAAKGSQHNEINGSQSNNIGGQQINIINGLPPGSETPITFAQVNTINNGAGWIVNKSESGKGIIFHTDGKMAITANEGRTDKVGAAYNLEVRDNFIMSQQKPTSKDGVDNIFKMNTAAPASFEHDDTHTTTVKGAIDLTGLSTQTENLTGAINTTGLDTQTVTITNQQTFAASNLDINNTVDITGDQTITGTSTAEVDHVSAGKSGAGHTHTIAGGSSAGATSAPD